MQAFGCWNKHSPQSLCWEQAGQGAVVGHAGLLPPIAFSGCGMSDLDQQQQQTSRRSRRSRSSSSIAGRPLMRRYMQRGGKRRGAAERSGRQSPTYPRSPTESLPCVTDAATAPQRPPGGSMIYAQCSAQRAAAVELGGRRVKSPTESPTPPHCRPAAPQRRASLGLCPVRRLESIAVGVPGSETRWAGPSTAPACPLLRPLTSRMGASPPTSCPP